MGANLSSLELIQHCLKESIQKNILLENIK